MDALPVNSRLLAEQQDAGNISAQDADEIELIFSGKTITAVTRRGPTK